MEYGLATLEAGLVPCRRPLIGGALLTCAGVEYGLATLEAGLVPCRRPLIGGAPPLSFPLIPESNLKGTGHVNRGYYKSGHFIKL